MRWFHGIVVGLAIAAASLGGGSRTGAASDAVLTCRQAVLRGAATLARARLASLRKCEDAKRAGKLPTGAVCRDETRVTATLGKAVRKLAAAIDRACGGADKGCGGPDDVTLAAMHWPSRCPDLEDGGCAAPLASCADVPTCVACLADAAVTRGLALVYAPFTFADRQTAKAIVGCQKALASAAAALADARLKVDVHCLAGRLAGKHTGLCPLPGDGTAAAKLTAVRAKVDAKVCKACGGADKRCGGADDLALPLVGVTSACPEVGTCDPTIASIADVVACFACTVGARNDCALAGAAPGAAEYPAGCAIVPPTPTPTTTPTPTETPVASPTLSATPTPTPSPVFCPASGGGVTTTVTITLASGGTPIAGASLVLEYLPELVRLPGAGDDPGVRARVVDLTAGALLGKGAPNNQDSDADREPDRMRFTLVAVAGVTGDIVKVVFDRCSGARLTEVRDYVCALSGAVGVDAVTPVPATCTLALAQGTP